MTPNELDSIVNNSLGQLYANMLREWILLAGKMVKLRDCILFYLLSPFFSDRIIHVV